tara:strand:- start:79 stop:264 length:186 start_codon:yes stop_codon:yes gene_type:complete
MNIYENPNNINEKNIITIKKFLNNSFLPIIEKMEITKPKIITPLDIEEYPINSEINKELIK